MHPPTHLHDVDGVHMRVAHLDQPPVEWVKAKSGGWVGASPMLGQRCSLLAPGSDPWQMSTQGSRPAARAAPGPPSRPLPALCDAVPQAAARGCQGGARQQAGAPQGGVVVAEARVPGHHLHRRHRVGVPPPQHLAQGALLQGWGGGGLNGTRMCGLPQACRRKPCAHHANRCSC